MDQEGSEEFEKPIEEFPDVVPGMRENEQQQVPIEIESQRLSHDIHTVTSEQTHGEESIDAAVLASSVDDAPGAFAVPGIHPDSEDVRVRAASSFATSSFTDVETTPISAECVDQQLEDARIRQIVEQALRAEREREAAIQARVIPDTTEETESREINVNGSEGGNSHGGRHTRRLIMMGMVLVLVAVVVVVLALTFRPTSKPPLSPTTSTDKEPPSLSPSLSPAPVSLPVPTFDTMGDTPAPSLMSEEPTLAPSRVPMSLAPTSNLQRLTELLSSVSLDGGSALSTDGSPQNDALNWLVGDTSLDSYSNDSKIQRYSLATLHYSTAGDNWTDDTGWLDSTNECGWYNKAGGSACTSEGALLRLNLERNNLFGGMPQELMLLGSLGKTH